MSRICFSRSHPALRLASPTLSSASWTLERRSGILWGAIHRPVDRVTRKAPMTDSVSRDPWLLTPGPLATADTTKRAMLHDWGSRDSAFIAMTARVRRRLVEIAGGGDLVAVLLQGSGTFVVEAALGTFVPRGGKVLILINGAYGARMVKMCVVMGRAFTTIETPEDVPPSPAAVDAALVADREITHVALVYCETTSGILNPVSAIADVVAARGRRLLIDAMSAFGALPLDMGKIACDAVMAS